MPNGNQHEHSPQQIAADDNFESQLREVWAQYIECLEQDAFSDSTKALKEKYLRLYRSYRNDREWKKFIS